MKPLSILLALTLLGAEAPAVQAGSKAPARKPDSEPLSPEKSLQSLRLPEGYQAAVVAAEPLVLDPVAFDWDGQGRLWVVEMADYPLGLDDSGAAGGRVRILEDVNGDGVYEKSSVFAAGLNFPNGILTWRGGCIITAAPDILYLEDKDGDGKADIREVLYTGLTEGNQQLRANGLRWGLDNWVYVAAGGHHGKHGADTRLLSNRTGKETLIGSRDFRIRPDTGAVEAQSGPAQFGRNRDDWGRWFGTQNSHPLWHYVLPEQYLKRNPHLAAPEGRVHLPGGSNPPVYPASPPEKRYHSFKQAGRYTSACGGMIYTDSLLFGGDQTHAFIAEPFHNLVQHLVLQPEGVSFSAQRPEPDGQPDFFASEDRWCRPVMIRTGPDGALWIADMYRYMIEHPHWLPEEGKADLLPHYRLGDDMGRIYRITRQGAEKRPIPRLDTLEAHELVTALESTNGWVRDKAQQMLLWKSVADAAPRLREMVRTAASPQTRLQALSTLDGLQALEPGDVLAALQDQHPGVLENALRLSENFDADAVLSSAWALAKSPHASVRMQLAFSLGQWSHPKAGEVLAQMLAAHENDTFIRIACLSSALPHLDALAASAGPHSREPLMKMAFGEGRRQALAALLRPSLENGKDLSQEESWDMLGQFLDMLRERQTSLDALRQEKPGDELSVMLGNAESVFAQSVSILSSPQGNARIKIDAAALLIRHQPAREQALQHLMTLLHPATVPDDLRLALDLLVTHGPDTVPENLLALWDNLLPQARNLALDALLARQSWTRQLLAAVKDSKFAARDLDATRRLRLTSHPDKKLQQQASALFNLPGSPSRTQVVEKYRSALTLPADKDRGHAVYQRACAVCHVNGSEGNAIGPDLRTVGAHPAEKILVNILDPNLDIQPGFHAYTCTLNSGEQLFGLIASESASSVNFKMPDGSSRNILRQDITTLRSLGVSLMPEGLEATLTPQDLADLLAFLKTEE
jgi:putative membrane-bound dehydrogenase-like protein